MSDEQHSQTSHSNAPHSSAKAAPGSDPAANAPAAGQPAASAEPPRYGEYAPAYEEPGHRQQPWQQPAWQHQAGSLHDSQAGTPPGWTPPPTPGLVPLRPLPFGTLLSAPFQALRRNPKITVGAALLLQGIPTIVVTVLLSGAAYLLLERAINANPADRNTLMAGAVGGFILLGVLSLVVTAISGALIQGVVVVEVARETLGEKLIFRSLWQFVRGRIGALIGWTFLVSLAWLVAVASVVALVVAVASIGGTAGVVGAVLVGVLGGVGLISLAIWINTKIALVPSAIVMERLRISEAAARSWRLTTGYFWKTFGLIALMTVIVYTVTQIIATPFALVGGMIGGIVAPTSLSSDDPASFGQLVVSQLGVNVLSAIVGSVIGAIGAVVQTAAAALLYIDLRMRKEGLDLQLVRFVEGRQAGQALPDPYSAPAPSAVTPRTWPGS